jgi:hypothetical protein
MSSSLHLTQVLAKLGFHDSYFASHRNGLFEKAADETVKADLQDFLDNLEDETVEPEVINEIKGF